MIRIALVFVVILLVGLKSHAQNVQEEVEQAVRNYVDAFYNGDTTKIHQSISPAVVKYGYFIGKGETTYQGEPMSFKEMIDYATKVGARGPNPKVNGYPKVIKVFDVLDQTASAKLTAWWGSDYILLAKTGNRWMITHVVWQSPPPTPRK